jgi:hypothetical protein
MATDLGKVGIVMKGTWSSSATYEVLDAVSYDTGLYIAKQSVPANTLPTNTTYWQAAIDASSFLTVLVKKTEIEVTTNASGIALLNMATANKSIVNLYVKSSATIHYIALLDVYQGTNYAVKAINGGDMTPVASQTLTIVVYYYDL